MSEEKQIKEMAKIIANSCVIYKVRVDKHYHDRNKDMYYSLAEDLLEHYQPKIPEDSVVLPKSQYDMLIALSSYEGSIEQLKNTVILPKEEYEKLTKELVTEQRAKEIAQEYFGIVRNETAEKILKDIMSCIEIDYCNGNEMLILNLCKTLAKQFGVEIKE